MAKKSTKLESASKDVDSTKVALQEAVALKKTIDKIYESKPTSEMYSASIVSEYLIRILNGYK